MKKLIAVLIAAMLFGAACTAGGGGNSTPPKAVSTGGSHKPVTLTVWDYFTERELSNLKDVLNQFSKQYPWIHINLVPGKSFSDYVRGITSGQTIDVAIDPGPDNVAKYCATGAFQNLGPYIQSSGLDMTKTFPPAALKYTSYKGTQCTLPLLTDAYGLYYNKDMFAAAHISGPPKTLSEFQADARKLTKFNPDGSIKVAGFVPLSTFYENANLYNGLPWGTTWYTAAGKSAFATDPMWAQMMQWAKSQIGFFHGYDNLQKFFSKLGGPNSEWSSAQAFENGEVAMAFDGEWRSSFIQNDKAKINYGTAPFPTADNKTQLYGAGQVGGTVIGIPKTSAHPNEAWALVSFLATNTKALDTLAELLKNVPTTYASLKDPKLVNDPHFKPFLEIFQNPNSRFYPLTTAGTAAADDLDAFVAKWQAGNVSSLSQGLKQLANQVDQQLQLGG
ncbi:MAG: multiple sugar transport system substrate-binding protein [Actinomycetota bacterium]|jgi:multiple sugar transport system substrate-binding protein|nr:multiple sugar transport system substrate-binding protein [Actinomycetota bacterium]